MTNSESGEAGGRPLVRFRAFVRLIVTRVRKLVLMSLPLDEAREVRKRVHEEGELTERFALMCALSAGIAILGLLQSSAAVVIGAMLVSPLMGPIAALGFGVASFDTDKMLRAAKAVGAGVAVGIIVGVCITWLSPIRNATPEIIARTAPTLLDLAVALLSGFAGGYATVHHRGETAIGVAIATALMPPLATVGYSIAVWRLDFVLGSSLLFLTNLAAIAFAFATVARLRGVARPLRDVKLTRRLIAAIVVGVIVLVAPLGMTLRRLTQEAFATQAVRREIATLLQVDGSMIAQLSVTWRNLEPPHINAIAVTNSFSENAETLLRERLTQRLGVEPVLQLQQLVATDSRAETEAMIQAAADAQSQARRALDAAAPPIQTLRAAARVPTLAGWADTSGRVVYLLVAPAADVSLDEVRREEGRLSTTARGWTAALSPPFEPRLDVGFADDAVGLDAAGEARLATVAWALQRWGATRVRVEGLSGRSTGATATSRRLAQARADAVAQRLRRLGIEVDVALADASTSRALFAEGGVARVRGADVVAIAGP